MGSDDNRDALRVPCDFPVRVYGQMCELAGRMLDISRSGLRIRVPLSRLLITQQLDLAAITHAVDQMLGAAFLADLHHEMLGQLIRKQLRTVRVCSVDPNSDELEIGCAFTDALTDEETSMLGVGLPPRGITVAAAFRKVPPPRRRGDPEDGAASQPRPLDYDGILHPSEGHRAEPLVGKTEGVVGEEVLLSLSAGQLPGDPGAGADAVIAAVERAFGTTPRLEIMDGLHMVWAGGVHMREIELPTADTETALLLVQIT